MVEWLAVILLIFFGLGFIIAEIIFVPGTTLLGLFGLIFTIIGIIISYISFGAGVGTIVLIISLIIGLGVLVYSLKSGVWEKFALKGSINSRVNEGETEDLQVGEEGVTVSSLRPMGKGEFKERIYEVTTLGNFLTADTKIRIVSIKNNKIIVEPIN
ncbi:MAG: NfeD family protein [Cyclobacteriaceae bacterium]|jgi:membrane-bound ClpP family serine protease